MQQYQALNNEIMNEYYEANMPGHAKPVQSTSTDTVSRFIKDKYVKKLWINEDDEDPVELYVSGELEKRRKKNEKKEQKKQDKKEKKKQDKKDKKKQEKKEKKDPNEPDLINFVEGDDFGDFQEPENQNGKQDENGIGDLVFGNGGIDDFGDFVTPEQKKNDDDFGDFTDPTASTGIDMNFFNTAAPATSSVHKSSENSNNLINNLSSLYSQSQPAFDSNNKYAALENLGHQYPQQPVPNAGMFFGMSIGQDSFGYNQPSAFPNVGFPQMTHQTSYPPSFSTSHAPFGHEHKPHFSTSTAPKFDSRPVFGAEKAKSSKAEGSSFSFATFLGEPDLAPKKSNSTQSANNLFKTKQPTKKAEHNPNAFSGLMTSQW